MFNPSSDPLSSQNQRNILSPRNPPNPFSRTGFLSQNYLSAANYSVPSPGQGPLSWIYSTISFDEDQLLASRGLDTIMHLRTLKLMMFITLFLCINLLLILPVNISGRSVYQDNNNSHNPFNEVGNFTKIQDGIFPLTISNIQDGSPKLWAHVFATYFLTLISFLLSYREYGRYARLRMRYHSQNSPHNYTLMIKQIPPFVSSPTQLHDFFERAFVGLIVEASMPRKDNTLRELQRKKFRTIRRMDQYRALAVNRSPDSFQRGGYIPLRKKTDALTFYQEKLAKLDHKIRDEKTKIEQKQGLLNGALHPSEEYSSVGFVVFSSIGAAMQSAQTLLYSDASKFKIRMAPEPDDLHWSLITVNARSRFMIKILTWVIFLIMIFFWGIPVSFSLAIANLQYLSQIKQLNWAVKVLEINGYVSNLVQGYLPALVLIFFQLIPPPIIQAILSLKGVYTKSQLEKETMSVYFMFQVVNVLFLSTTLGSLIHIQNGQFVFNLGKVTQSVGTQSGFIINYLIVYALSSCPQTLIRWVPLFASVFNKIRYYREVKLSDQMSRDFDHPEKFHYGVRYANALLLFILSISFCVISPIVTIFGLLALGMEYLVCKYLHMYTSDQRFHSGARLWPNVFDRIVVCLVVFQVLVFGVLSMKLFVGSIALLPLPIISYFFVSWTHNRFFRISRFLPAVDYPPDEEADLAPSDGVNGYQGEKYRFAYRDPGMA